MNPPHALLLDLGNVLVRLDLPRGRRALSALCGLAPDEVQRRILRSGLALDFGLGRVDRLVFADAIAQVLDMPSRPEAVLAAWCDIIDRHDENLALLTTLVASHRVVLASNTDPAHFDHIRRLAPELDAMHAWVLSHEVGAVKPDPIFYRCALAAAEVPPDVCLFVDDLPENVEAAQRAGIRALLHPPGASLALTLRDV